MSDDLPSPGREGRSAEDVATIGWGSDESPHRARGARFLRDLGRDPRTRAALAGLGAVASFAALVGDWIIVTPPYEGPDGGPPALVRGASDVGNYGGGYLFSTVALMGCLALVLFGSPGVRHNARMVGLAVSAAAGGLLLAVTMTMRDSIRIMFEPNEGIEVAAGQGLVMAYVGTTAFAATLLLAAPLRQPVAATGPFPATVATRPGVTGAPTVAEPAGEDTSDQTGVDPAHEALAGWSWRRPRSDRPAPDGDGLPPPPDLTVAPAPPFTRPEASYSRPDAPYLRPETSYSGPPETSYSRPEARGSRPEALYARPEAADPQSDPQADRSGAWNASRDHGDRP